MVRPTHEPTDSNRKTVESMSGYGIPEDDIALVIGIDPKTLRKHYRRELDLGHIKANSAVAQNLFKRATGDGSQSVTAAIFWAKTRMGWRETTRLEHSGPEGRPIQLDLTKLTADELEKLEAIIGPLAERPDDDEPDQGGEGET